MSLDEFLPAVVQFLLVTGVAFVVIALLTSLVRYQQLVTPSAPDAAGESDGPQSLRIELVRRLGTGPRERAPFLVFLVDPPGSGADAEPLADRTRAILSSRVRSTDAVLRADGGRIGIVVSAPRRAARTIAGRIPVSALHRQDETAAGETDAAHGRVAVATFPEDGDRADDLLAAVDGALDAGSSSPAGLSTPGGAPLDSEPDDPRPTPGDPMAGAPAPERRLLDETTGLLRPEQLDGVLRKRFSVARKELRPLSVICMQIDHLERYREHYGPSGIDAILGHLGCYLQEAVREVDLPCRHQQDGFVLIMGCSPRHALGVAERLGAGIDNLAIQVAGAALNVTVTSGVAGYPDHGGVPRQLLDHALSALGAARSKGRNQAQLYGPGMAAPQRDESTRSESF